jgi:uncharacterized membrane protein
MNCDSLNKTVNFTAPVLTGCVSSVTPFLCILALCMTMSKGFDSGQPQTPDYTGVVLTGLYVLLPIVIYFGVPVLCETSNTLAWILYIISILGMLTPFLFMIYINLRQSAESKKYELGK